MISSAISKCISATGTTRIFRFSTLPTMGNNSNNIINRRRRTTRETDGIVSSDEGNSSSSSSSWRQCKPQKIVVDSKIFHNAAKEFLQRVQLAVEPMKQYNSVFQVLRLINTIESQDCLKILLKPDQGSYILQVDYDTRTMALTTPLSGSFTYVLCSQTGNFVGMEDGHVLEGLLVRDLIRQCHGLPKF